MPKIDTCAISRNSSPRAYPADCEFGLKVSRQVSVSNDSSNVDAWRLYLSVTEGNNVDPNVFLYQRKTSFSANIDYDDVFIGVCSPVDLEDYPTQEPNDESADGTGFFRLADVDLLTRNRDKLDRLWELIETDLTALVSTLANICELEDPAIITIGDLSSSSSSPEPRFIAAMPKTALEPDVIVSKTPNPAPLQVIQSDDDLIPIQSRFVPIQYDSESTILIWELTNSSYDIKLQVNFNTLQIALFIDGKSLGSVPAANDLSAIINYTRNNKPYCIYLRSNN